MEENKGLIFDIQSYSVHDGPGCRTICFMSGCPLKCEWCANPESWHYGEKLMFSQSKCKSNKGCKMCVDVCSQKSININEDKSLNINWEKCRGCNTFECTKACYYEALKLCGKWYDIDSLINILSRDRQYWGDTGGVTFSGGEPLLQSEFLIEVLKKCKGKYIHTAIETTAYKDTKTFLEVMKSINFAFIDVKHMDREKHKEKTGVYNDLILKNIEELAKSSWNGRLVLRMPIIRNFNDSDENIIKTAEFMNSLGLYEINILPFHRLGDSKWNQLGKVYTYKSEEGTPQDKMDYIQDLFLDREIACYVGHETNF